MTFNPVIKVHLIPDEDRRSEWTTMAVDSALFERRIKLFEEIFVLCNSYCVFICFNLCLEKIKVDL